jgi:Flp pilus assembly protein TadB
MTIGRIFWAGLFAGLFAARLKRNNRKYPDRSPLFRGGKAAFDVGTAALLVTILGFLLEVATFMGAVATTLFVVEVLRRRRTANQER